ncbi:MAG: inorganic phosphate transporter [Alteromonadaceae bacterium]|nr:inorganic phosphate transporter [Alteromonadaceae bacterium]
MDILSAYGLILVILAASVGLLMAWGIGANDVANAMGTSVGAKALTIKQAILVAMVFEFAGAYLAGGEVTSTIRKGIIDSSYFVDSPELLVFGMISALTAAGIWLVIASYRGWPVSTTHSIVGGIVGFAVVGVGMEVVVWGKVGGIVMSWIVTPALAGFLAYAVYMSADKFILSAKDPLKNARRYVPLYMALAGFVLSLVTIKKGLKHVGLDIPDAQGYLLAVAIAVVVAVIGKFMINKVLAESSEHSDVLADENQFSPIEKVFAVLMIITACCMAFAHGSNDVANAIGPLAAVVSVVSNDGEIVKKAALDWWILPLGAFGIVAGLALFGKRVMHTIGHGITKLTPSKGFAAELAAASTVVIASGTGLPISTTQTLVGAVIGVGLARGVAAVNMKTSRTIVISWVVTLPAGAILSVLFFYLLQMIFVV